MIVINPGSGPVDQATEEHAAANVEAFGKDLEAREVKVLKIERAKELDYGEGRFAFQMSLSKGEHETKIEVQMPGLPLDKVRFLGEPQNIWHFPRLYIDGSSWVWKFALNVSMPDRDKD